MVIFNDKLGLSSAKLSRAKFGCFGVKTHQNYFDSKLFHDKFKVASHQPNLVLFSLALLSPSLSLIFLNP